MFLINCFSSIIQMHTFKFRVGLLARHLTDDYKCAADLSCAVCIVTSVILGRMAKIHYECSGIASQKLAMAAYLPSLSCCRFCMMSPLLLARRAKTMRYRQSPTMPLLAARITVLVSSGSGYSSPNPCTPEAGM